MSVVGEIITTGQYLHYLHLTGEEEKKSDIDPLGKSCTHFVMIADVK